MTLQEEFRKALEIGRPPNVKKLFPHSRALLVSGKVIDRALTAKGQAMTIAANGRSNFVIRGALRAAQLPPRRGMRPLPPAPPFGRRSPGSSIARRHPSRPRSCRSGASSRRAT